MSWTNKELTLFEYEIRHAKCSLIEHFIDSNITTGDLADMAGELRALRDWRDRMVSLSQDAPKDF